jgi:hypothetical protein
MSYNTILTAVDGKVATITLNRPEVLNALNDELMDELGAALLALMLMTKSVASLLLEVTKHLLRVQISLQWLNINLKMSIVRTSSPVIGKR